MQEADENKQSLAMQLTFCTPPMSHAEEELMALQNEFIFVVDKYRTTNIMFVA